MTKSTTRRSLFALAAGSASLALAACSGENAAKTSETGTGAATGTSGGGTRTVTDALKRTVKVPLNPKRVVVTHNAGTQPLYDLGLFPVGKGADIPHMVPAAVEARLNKVPIVVSGTEPSVEKIAALKPDLILVPDVTKEDMLSQLKELAPTYAFTLRGGGRGDWTSRTKELGAMLGKADKVASLDAAFKKRVKQISTDHADVIKGKVAGVVASYEDNNFYAWGSRNMTGRILTSLGFTYSSQEDAAVKGEQNPEATVSFEKVDSVVGDVDVLFLDSNMRAEYSGLMKSLQATALFKRLKSVKAGHAYPIGKSTVAGYSDANYSLDLIEKALKKMSA